MPAPLLIFGADGQVGRALIKMCHAQGKDVKPFTRSTGDITSLKGLRAIAEAFPDSPVINAAAYTAVDKAEEDRERAHAVNATGGAFLAAIFGNDRPLIHFSTDYVFDGTATSPYGPEDDTDPLGVYGLSKRAGESAVLASTFGTVIRTAWVYSETGNNFLKTMIRVGQDRGALRVVADQIGTPTHADDIAQATLALLDAMQAAAPGDLSGIYHLTAKGQASWYDFAEEIFATLKAQTGKTVSVEPITTADYPTPAKRPAYSVLDCDKIDQIQDVSRPEWKAPIERTVATVLAQSESGES